MINLKFSKSFDDCLQQAYRFQTGITADKTSFTAISAKFADPFAADFLDLIEAADALPTYEDELGQQSLLTQQIEAKMVEARQHYQKLMFNVEVAWPGDDSIARVFGNSLYDKARSVPLKMINLLQNAYNNANSVTYKASLISAGFLQVDIDLLNTLADELTARNNAQDNFIMKTYERTETKNKAFNLIWDTMVLISNASKLIFKDSPAKIEFYLLYPESGPTGLPGKIQSLAYNSATAKFTWQADTKATSYQIETSPDGSEWLQIYEGSAAEYVNVQGPGTGIARCRGVNNNGSGSWSDNLDYTVPVPVPVLVSIGFDGANNRTVVTFNTVPYADLYLIYQSVVPIGNPAGYFDEIGTPTSSPFNTVSANNAMREYYYVKASYNDILSVQSNIVYLDVPVA